MENYFNNYKSSYMVELGFGSLGYFFCWSVFGFFFVFFGLFILMLLLSVLSVEVVFSEVFLEVFSQFFYCLYLIKLWSFILCIEQYFPVLCYVGYLFLVSFFMMSMLKFYLSSFSWWLKILFRVMES